MSADYETTSEAAYKAAIEAAKYSESVFKKMNEGKGASNLEIQTALAVLERIPKILGK